MKSCGFFIIIFTAFLSLEYGSSFKRLLLRGYSLTMVIDRDMDERGKTNRGNRSRTRDSRSNVNKPPRTASWSSGSTNERTLSIRQGRVARSLRDEITEIISDVDIKAIVYPDEFLLRGTSVVDVEVSADLGYAKVFVSVLGNSVERRQVFVWLCENVGQIKYSLSKRLSHMRRVPDLFFKLADTQSGSDLISLIEEVAPKQGSTTDDDIDFEEVDEDL